MMGDDRSVAPPLELVGPLGQVVDVGGGAVPGLAPTPLPGALGTASPGLAAAAVTPAPLPGPPPAWGPDDPRSLAITIARLAEELLGGPGVASLAPVPLAPGSAMTPSHVQLPASPGLGAAAPGPAPVASSTVGRPRPAAPPNGGAVPSSTPDAVTPAAGRPPVAPSSTPDAVTPAAGRPPVASSGARDVRGASDSSDAFEADPVSRAIDRLAAELFGGAGAPVEQVPVVEPSRGPALGAPTAAALPSAGVTPAAGGAPRAPDPASPSATTSPFSAPLSFDGLAFAPAAARALSFDALAGFDVAALAGAMPALADAPAIDAPPSYLPATASPRAAPDRGGAPVVVSALDTRPIPVRDLGGNAFDPHAVRRDFPILEERVHGGKRLIWLDNAATTQKPRAVIDRLSYFYEHENSNIHRAAHTLAARATDAYEGGRESVRRFLNAGSVGEVIFVRGATEGINLVAQSWGRRHVAAGDEIVITHLEHHANIVPWQQLCAATGARLRVAPVDDRGDIVVEAYERLLGPRTRLVALPQVSNAIGTVTPAREMIELAHRHGAVVLLDGAQAVSHMRVDVQQLDCDFYVLSGHKVFAPTGIGAVFGKRAVLETMPPWQGGGNMIQDVTFERTTYQPPPARFEAGTGNIADAVGLGAALDYVTRVGIDNIDRYEHELLAYADRQLATVPGLTMIGAPRAKAGVLSFVLDGQRTEDVGSALDREGIAVRSGHHCAQPILRRLGVEASVRASLAFYNVCEDIDALVDALRRLQAGR
jgi:cysteine desulfurase / selenocysteine lyase